MKRPVVTSKRPVIARKLQLHPWFRPAVWFKFPTRRVFPGSYLDVGIVINRHDLHMDDIRFEVSRPGEPLDHTCLLSVSKGRADYPMSIRLLAGPRAGSYALRAVETLSGKQLGRVTFMIDPTVPHGTAGPSYWTRPTDGPPGIAIGGGAEGVQNVGAVQSLRNATWRIGVALLDFNDNAFPADAPGKAAAIKRWKDMIVDGAPFGAGNASVASYYAEDSFGLLTITGEVFEPIATGADVTSYFPERTDALQGIFTQDDPPTAASKYYQAVDPNDWQALVTAVTDTVDLRQFDTFFFVVRNYNPAGKTFERFPWPRASALGKSNVKIAVTKDDGTIVSEDYQLGCFVMPDSFDFVKSTMTTICHELAHTFGLDDMYTPFVKGDPTPSTPNDSEARNLGGWDPMDYEGALAHHCLAHKLMLGWVVDPALTAVGDRDQIVRSFDFSATGTVEETLKIAPLEAPLGAGLHHGAEVRISDGHNYYFEYRNSTASVIGDQSIGAPAVVGTDAMLDTSQSSSDRPKILLLSGDPDFDSAVLTLGDDFERTNLVSGSQPMALRVEVIDIKPTHAEVKIKFSAPPRPNPSITNWNTDPDRWWQSVDIEVRNEKTDADPGLYANKMWLGQPNRLVARVTNSGTVDAPGVVVAFTLKDYTVGGAPEGDEMIDVRDVPAGATQEFEVITTPKAKTNAHYCVVVRIKPYQHPTTLQLEDDVYDNLAQSNYVGLESIIASPPSRPATRLTLGNPYEVSTRIRVEPEQAHGGFISYLSHRWLKLEGRKTGAIDVESEYAPAVASAMQSSDYIARLPFSLEREMGMRARLALCGFAEEPEHRHPARLDGADVDLVAGFRTRVGSLRITQSSIAGRVMRVVASAPPRPVGGGKMLMTLGEGRTAQTIATSLDEHGAFQFTRLKAEPGTPFLLSFLGHAPDAACEHESFLHE